MKVGQNIFIQEMKSLLGKEVMNINHIHSGLLHIYFEKSKEKEIILYIDGYWSWIPQRGDALKSNSDFLVISQFAENFRGRLIDIELKEPGNELSLMFSTGELIVYEGSGGLVALKRMHQYDHKVQITHDRLSEDLQSFEHTEFLG